MTWWRFGEKAFQVTLNIKCFSFYKYNFQWTRILQHIFKATERSNVSHILETSWCKEKCSKKYSFVFPPCFDDFSKLTSMMPECYKWQWFQYLRYIEGSILFLNQTSSHSIIIHLIESIYCAFHRNINDEYLYALKIEKSVSELSQQLSATFYFNI